MFKRRKKHVLKVAAFKRKNMLPKGSIFFPLKVAPLTKENNYKGYYIEKPPKLNYANRSVFENRQILMPQIHRNILWLDNGIIYLTPVKSQLLQYNLTRDIKRLGLQLWTFFDFFYFLFKSFVKVELIYVFTINLFTIAENYTEKWFIL